MERLGGQHNDGQSCQRQRKNPRQKWKKPENVLRSKTTNRQTAFKVTIRRDCLLAINKRTSFATSYASVELRQHQSLSQRIIFFLTEWYSFFFLLCLPLECWIWWSPKWNDDDDDDDDNNDNNDNNNNNNNNDNNYNNNDNNNVDNDNNCCNQSAYKSVNNKG